MITVEIEESENLTVDVESYKGTSKFDLSISIVLNSCITY